MLVDACLNDSSLPASTLAPPPHYKPRSDGVKLINLVNSADYKLIIVVFHTTPDQFVALSERIEKDWN